MENLTEAVEAFFKEFEVNSNHGAPEAIVSQFADPFMAADSGGARAVTVAQFMAALPQRRKLFESIGSSSAALASLQQTPLDDHYVLVNTEWRMQLDRGSEPARSLTLRSTFIVRRSAEGLRIVFYLSHEDLMAVLREHALTQKQG